MVEYRVRNLKPRPGLVGVISSGLAKLLTVFSCVRRKRPMGHPAIDQAAIFRTHTPHKLCTHKEYENK